LNKGLIKDTEENISEEAIKNSSAKIFPKGTLLIALYGATIGKLAFLGVDAATNQAVCGIYKNEKIDSNYLYYYLFSKKPSLVKQGIGGAQPNISQGILKNLELPIPPLPEQQAIVSKIEELLSDLENGKQQLLIAQQQLKVYRQSLLKWAFEGKLTNKNLKDGELRKGWKIEKLGNVLKTIDGDRGPNYPNKKDFFDEEYCLFLSTKNVRVDRFLFEEKMFITKEKDAKLRGGKLQLNDVVITTRGTLGNVALYNENIPFKNIRINSGMLILRIVEEGLSNYFLMKFITSPNFIFQLKEKQSGTAQPQIPANILREIEIPIPSLSEQQLIVDELESKLTVCDKIEETISQSLQQAETLKQSILKKAFEGRLV
jgi:type I restriction enzyme S subunit